MPNRDLQDLRRDYGREPLRGRELPAGPDELFTRWFEDARQGGEVEPNAMVLATADEEGQPSARVVLLKGHDERGLHFYTNYLSRKGLELAARPRAALCFHWKQHERQVRIEGTVARLPQSVSDEYFARRPAGSRLAAAASPQSRPLRDREELEALYAELESAHPGGELPRPESWGGYALQPISWEFWQGQASRMHDRFRFARAADGSWRHERLAP